MAKHPAKYPTPTTPTPDIDERIITTAELLIMVPLDRSTIWRMCRDNAFPKPIQLTKARIGWRRTAVLAWIAAREQQPIAAREYFHTAREAD